MNWLKLNKKKEEYTILADKLLVRDIIDNKLGKGHVFPLLGSWDKFEDIKFDALPEQFVLKCNHDSGSVKIISNKSKLKNEDFEELKKFFNRKLKVNPFPPGREYPYKNIKSKIIAEQYMISNDGSDIRDYKFFCFEGKPEILFIATDRSKDLRFDFLIWTLII